MYNDLTAAVDNHNVANGDGSWFDTRVEAAKENLVGIAQGATYGVLGAAVAGISSIINSGVAFANFVGDAHIAPLDVHHTLKMFDDDLATYYERHEEGVELAGFAIGALIPGTAGIKMMQAAKAGVLGTNTARSIGLMQSLTADYATAAKLEYASTTNPFAILNANTVKALAQGAGNSVLEAAAFESMVTATMFQSPVLRDMDAKDLAWNLTTGILVGGGLGAVLNGTMLTYGIKKARDTLAPDLFPARFISELGDNADPSMKIIHYYHQKLERPKFDETVEKLHEVYDIGERAKLFETESAKTVEKLDILLTQAFLEFSGGDPLIASQLAAKFKDVKNLEDVAAALIHSKGASRISESETVEHGDIFYPTHGMGIEAYNDAVKSGELSKLFVNDATAATQGYRVIGDMSELQIATAGKGEQFGNSQAAFSAGYDMFRNANGVISVNPQSKILQASNLRRAPTSQVVDFEQNGAIVDKGVPGLADLATKDKKIEVRGDTVLAGNLDPIKVAPSLKYNPTEGSYLEAQARTIWAQAQNDIKWDKLVVGENDLPLLERAYYDGEKSKGFLIKLEDGTNSIAPTGERLRDFIEAKKRSLVRELDGQPLDEIALRLNVSQKWLLGENDEVAKLRPGMNYQLPRFAKIDFPEMGVGESGKAYEAYNAANIPAAVEYQTQVQFIDQKHKMNFANFAGSASENFIDINFRDPGRAPTGNPVGAGLFGFANGNYGSAGGWAQFIGQLTSRLKIEKKTERMEALTPAIASVKQTLGPKGEAEAALLNNRLLQSPEAWVFSPKDSLKIIKRADFAAAVKGIKPSEEIELSEPVAELFRVHKSINAEAQGHVKNLKGAAGIMDDADPGVIYPIPVDTTKLKHFVIVKPIGINSSDKARVIAAKDVPTLESLIKQVDTSEFRVITKAETEEFHKALGDYDYALGLNESAVDSSLKREGKLSQHFPTIGEDEFFDRLVAWHSRQADILTTRMVEHRYSGQFKELENLGKQYTNIATSQWRNLTEALEKNVKDPYYDIVKTALDISRASEYKWWTSFNDFVKNTIQEPVNALRNVFDKSKNIDDNFLNEVNNIAKKFGMGAPYQTAAQIMMANKNIVDKPWLSAGIAKAQGILSSTLLQFDALNALNNIVGTPILTSAETKFLISAIEQANPQVAGKLHSLLSVGVPESEGVVMPSATRLQHQALANMFRDTDGTLLKRYQEIGAVTDVMYQQRQMLNDLTFSWKESAAQVDTKINSAAEFARKWTGNKLAEQTTRFVAADVMRQITDLAIEAGVLKNAKEANEYISLFVNKTQGNYLYSQRPIVFQGVVGQAVSLFQTYQFNLMQQLFRYVGEGDKKAMATLLGLQGSIYGMQGLPAFNFLNTHIVGNASGNTEHKDLYYAANSVFGKSLGDWLLYGAGSNALALVDPRLRVNLYSRGDINPRQVTVLPTSLEDVPVVSASVRFVQNLWNTAKKITNGGDFWQSVSQGVEHNSLSRPLAGLAQIVQGYTSTSQGSVLTVGQDRLSAASFARAVGGKPFDEAVALDALYRINAYRAKDTALLQDLGAAVKTTFVSGKAPSEQQIVDFASEYAKRGGRIENFGKFMAGEMMAANQSQVNKVADHLQTPFGRQMQVIMGGTPLPDFLNQPPPAP